MLFRCGRGVLGERDTRRHRAQNEENREQRNGNRSGHARRNRGTDRASSAQQAFDTNRNIFARNEDARRRHRTMRPRRHLGHLRQTERVGTDGAGQLQHEIVTRDFTFDIHLTRDIPNRGIEEQQRRGDALKTVRPVVGAQQVRKLMQADLVDFGRVERMHQMGRQQNHRIEEADRNRNFDLIRHA